MDYSNPFPPGTTPENITPEQMSKAMKMMDMLFMGASMGGDNHRGQEGFEDLLGKRYRIADDHYKDKILAEPGKHVDLLRTLSKKVPATMERVTLSIALSNVIVFRPPRKVWDELVKKKVHELFYELLMDDGMYDGDEDYVHAIHQGLYNMVMISGISGPWKDEKIVRWFLDHCADLYEKWWEHRHLLEEDAPWSNVCWRRTMQRAVFCYAVVARDRRRLSDFESSKHAHLSLWCWQFIPAYDPHHTETSTCALDMIIYKTTQAQQNAFIQRHVIDGFGASAFVRRFKRELKEPAILDGDLKIAMKMLDVFCAHLKQTQRALVQQEVHVDVVAACERQTQRGDAGCEWDVYARAAAPLETIIEQKRIMYDLITMHGFVKFMARAAILAARFASSDDAEPIDGWEKLFHRLAQLPSDNDKLDGGLYRDDLRRILKPIHSSTLSQIKKLKPTAGQRRAAKMWAGFGEAVFGFVGEIRSREDLEEVRRKRAAQAKSGGEGAEGAGGEAEKGLCSLVDCRYHDVAPPHALSKCSGCASVFYCNGTCQMKDWKAGHKGVCKQLKAQKAGAA
ncbi:unnamed protein product [Peniophora sp. CBMAI 1063]|nr:unnamed protein product [Peniophora sp. CBMAI 1063]